MKFYESLKFVILGQKFYRLANFRVNKTYTKLVTDKKEIFATLIFILLCVLELCGIFYKFYYAGDDSSFEIYDSTAGGFQLVTFIVYIELSLTVLTSFYFFFVSIFKRKQQIKFLEKVEKIDETMRNHFNINIDYRMYSLNSLMSLIFTLIYYNIILSGILLKFLIQLKSWFGVVGFVTYIVESGMSGIFTYGYISYVSLIRDRMWKLNEKLQVIIQKPPEELEKEYETKELLCNEMMRFTKLYKNLCSCVEDINQIYGSSMVLFFAHDFTLLTTQIFGMFYISFFGDPQQLVYKLLALAVWLLPNIIKMTIICFVCHFTRNMIETCGTYIRKFSNEAKEDDLADLVDMFSLQSIHLKTEFSANNFFSIDMSLFFSIISACTTYLVILIQFKNYEDENVDVVLHENFTTTLSVN